jgi:uncharacterized LabA/DUF88 family protein
MGARVIAYVDGENHFFRAKEAAGEIVGSSKAPEAIGKVAKGSPYEFVFDLKLQLFWSWSFIPCLRAHLLRAVYVCSYTGNEETAHEARVAFRQRGFDPILIHEVKQLKDQRDNLRRTSRLIDKPKGCDIALTTRMVEDAALNLYDRCFLFTSDADFVPAIEAVRRMGKSVWVFGFKSCLGDRSPYLHVPDEFVDLSRQLATVYKELASEIHTELLSLGEDGPFNPSYPMSR